jgi:hypothetical protein
VGDARWGEAGATVGQDSSKSRSANFSVRNPVIEFSVTRFPAAEKLVYSGLGGLPGEAVVRRLAMAIHHTVGPGVVELLAALFAMYDGGYY